MALYCKIDGVKRRIKKLYVGIDGETREITRLYTGINGIKKRIFGESILSLLFTSNDSIQSGEKSLVTGRRYDLWLIGSGGNGGNGGSGWGLYRGGGGGAGGTGAYVHVTFIALDSMRISWQITGGTVLDVSVWAGTTRVLHFSTDSSNTNGRNGDDAGAFDPNPDGGAAGSAGVYAIGSDVSPVSGFVYDIEHSNGTTAGGSAGNRYGQSAPSPVSTPYTNPQHVASAGQDAYSNTDLASICLGNAGGGGNEESKGGKGAPGGLICIES